jgi:hypothetical protein
MNNDDKVDMLIKLLKCYMLSIMGSSLMNERSEREEMNNKELKLERELKELLRSILEER